MSEQQPLKLSIVITTRNRVNDLKACLKSIIRSVDINFKFEVIIVDDASTDETSRLDPKAFAIQDLQILRNSRQMMMVQTRNKGGRAAKGEWVLFIADYNEIAEDMIVKLVRYGDAHPDVGIVGPKMCYYPSKKPYLDFQKINFYTGQTVGFLNTSNCEYPESDGIPNVFMVRKATLEKCGYFDESIVQTYTEPDLGLTARQHGYKCVIVLSAETYHRVPETGGARPLGGNQFKQKAFFLIRNRTVMVMRYGTLLQKIIYMIFFSWAWPILYSVLVLPERRFDLVKLYWVGYLDGIRYAFFKRKLDSPEQIISRLKAWGL